DEGRKRPGNVPDVDADKVVADAGVDGVGIRPNIDGEKQVLALDLADGEIASGPCRVRIDHDRRPEGRTPADQPGPEQDRTVLPQHDDVGYAVTIQIGHDGRRPDGRGTVRDIAERPVPKPHSKGEGRAEAV